MNPANVDTFADNIVRFISTTGLDGVDFDWEYPGALDIPGIPPGLKTDGPNYLHFLKTLRNKLTASKSISIAAPASYWYLRSFPIADMSLSLDYIVYMTYDLHGQWDYGHQWSQEGCPGGNCLRSHVNSTETRYSLAMVTKAGVHSNKITVGVSSYGRSFAMTKADCTGPDCTYLGPESSAAKGQCTQTAGYISNAEIDAISLLNDTSDQVRTFYDAGSDSNFLVYNKTQWVAYMDDTTKTSRTNWYKALNMAGTVDWAVDLQSFTGDDHNPAGDDNDGLPATTALSPCDQTFVTVEDLEAASDSMPIHCRGQYTVGVLSSLLDAALKNYTDLMNAGYDCKFTTYANAVAGSAGDTVHKFMNDNGNKYFSCIVSSHWNCKYCFDGSGDQCTKSCSPNPNFGCRKSRSLAIRESLPVTRMTNQTEPYPPDYSQRGYGPNNPYEQSVYWTLQDNKADIFWGDLLSNTGIPKDKIKFGQYNRGNACPPSAQPGDDCWGDGIDYNIPMPSGYNQGDVSNPKALVQKGLDNANHLGPQLKDTLLALQVTAYQGDAGELIDSISLPILMMVEAVENMFQVAEIADKITEEQRKAIILAFIGAILFFVPVAGEILGAVTELADLASIITILGATGNAALDIYTIVDDPQNAPLAIMGLVFAPAALADVATITKAANIRRGMKDGDIAKLGTKLSGRMKSIKKVTGTCVKNDH